MKVPSREFFAVRVGNASDDSETPSQQKLGDERDNARLGERSRVER